MDIRHFAFWLGVVFLALGILGFIPALVEPASTMDPSLTLHAGHGRLFGIFPVNAVHNVIHLTFGVWGIVAAKNFLSSRLYCRVNTVVYALLTFMGVFPVLNTVFGLTPLHGNMIWLHGIIALSSGYFGYVWSEQSHHSPASTNTKVTVR